MSNVTSVHIDTQGSADREIGIGLHDLDGQVVRIDVLLNFTPGDARLYRDLPFPGVEGNDVVEFPHVELQSVVDSGLPTHAVAATAD